MIIEQINDMSWIINGQEPVFVRIAEGHWVNATEIAEIREHENGFTILLKSGTTANWSGSLHSLWATATVRPE